MAKINPTNQSRIVQKQEVRLTVSQYAAKAKVTERTVYNRIKAGVIKSEQPAPHYPHEIILFF